MRLILIASVLMTLISTEAYSQVKGKTLHKYGLSVDFDLIVRQDDLDQEGIGFALALGGVKYLGEGGRFRLIPNVEYGSFKWEEDDLFYNYFALNLMAQMDIIKYTRFSIPMSGGLVLDYSENDVGMSRIRESYRLYFGLRLDFKSNWAIEFFNFGMALNNNFISLRCTYLRMEYQF